MQGANREARLAHGKRQGECQAQPIERAGLDKVRALRHPQNGSRQVWQLGCACRQPETARRGCAFQTQGTEGRNTGRGLYQEWLSFQRLQSGQAFQLFQD